MVAACEKSGKWRKALRILDDMRMSGYKFYENSVLDRLFKSLVQAWSLASSVTSPKPGEMALTEVELLMANSDRANEPNESADDEMGQSSNPSMNTPLP